MNEDRYSKRRPIDTRSLLIHLLLLLSGLVSVLGGTFVFVSPSWISNLIIGLGIGLLGTAVAGLLTAWIIAPHSAEALEKTISRVVGAPAIVLPRRTALNETYLKMIEGATEIEITGLTLKAFFVSCSVDQLVKYIKQGKSFKILLLFPDAYVRTDRTLFSS